MNGTGGPGIISSWGKQEPSSDASKGGILQNSSDARVGRAIQNVRFRNMSSPVVKIVGDERHLTIP